MSRWAVAFSSSASAVSVGVTERSYDQEFARYVSVTSPVAANVPFSQ